MATEPKTIDDILAENVIAARARLRINQASLAARMRALGWKRVRQTVTEVEACCCRILAGNFSASPSPSTPTSTTSCTHRSGSSTSRCPAGRSSRR